MPYLCIQSANGTRLKDLDFADDISLLVETRDTLQEMTTSLEKKQEKSDSGSVLRKQR